MVFVDDRTGSKDLYPLLQRLHIPCQLARLEYGDAAFEGNGPDGPVAIGIERKNISDMLDCIEDARYSGHQRPGMAMLYSKSFLILEGLWCAGESNGCEGLLMQGYRGGSAWGPMTSRGRRSILYSKLYRYLISISLTGVIITPSMSAAQTAIQISEMYQYFQKKWLDHTSMIEVQKLAIPVLTGKPSLVRRWAHQLDDIGVKFSEEAEHLFKLPIKLATGCETDWMKIKGIGVATAQRIVREINGWRN